MYKGSFLFANRIVTNKTNYVNNVNFARGSSLYVTDGFTISRPQKQKTISELYVMSKNVTEQIENIKKELETKDFDICDEFDKRARGLNEGTQYYERLQIAQNLWESLQKCETEKILISALIERKIKYSAKAKRAQEKRAEKGVEGYRLNKSKVKDKCTAFFELERSRKFCAFYSVSFPQGNSEEDIYKVWNTFLTNLRKTYGLKDYLWVAEYQKNGTLHYHMIVNVFMDIKRVNRAMAIALFHQKMLGSVSIDKYNGVDVERVTGSRNKLNSYLTKYISKSETHNYKRAPWRCSQSISALFTSVKIDAETSLKLQQEFAKLKTHIYENDYAVVEYFNVKDENGLWYNLPNQYREKIIQLNNLIIKQLEREKYEKIHRHSIQREIPSLQVSERDEARQIGRVVQLPLFQSYCN